MNNYKMITQTSTGALPWEYNFEIASDEMAIEYTMRHTAQFACVDWFMSMLLFRDNEFIGEYRVNPPTVRVVERKR